MNLIDGIIDFLIFCIDVMMLWISDFHYRAAQSTFNLNRNMDCCSIQITVSVVFVTNIWNEWINQIFFGRLNKKHCLVHSLVVAWLLAITKTWNVHDIRKIFIVNQTTKQKGYHNGDVLISKISRVGVGVWTWCSARCWMPN